METISLGCLCKLPASARDIPPQVIQARLAGIRKKQGMLDYPNAAVNCLVAIKRQRQVTKRGEYFRWASPYLWLVKKAISARREWWENNWGTWFFGVQTFQNLMKIKLYWNNLLYVFVANRNCQLTDLCGYHTAARQQWQWWKTVALILKKALLSVWLGYMELYKLSGKFNMTMLWQVLRFSKICYFFFCRCCKRQS